jgi:hypothetical protein
LQCYLVVEGDSALLIGTGVTVHQEQLIAQLEELLPESARLSIMPLGYDFTRLCNARPIADRFGVEGVWQSPLVDVPRAWLNFRPEFPADDSDRLRGAEARTLKTGRPITVDRGGVRQLDVLVPPLRLLPNTWVYDPDTRTMFTVDTFTWVWRLEDRGPWVLTDADEDFTTVQTVEYALLRNRYWWLAGADTERIRRAFADLFDRYEIETIAPEYGCVLKGADVVSRHYQMLDDVLAAAGAAPAQGVEVGTWSFAGAR